MLATDAIHALREAKRLAGDRAGRIGYQGGWVAPLAARIEPVDFVIVSNFTEGYEQLEAVKRKYGNEPWFKSVRGNITWYLLAESEQTMCRRVSPKAIFR